jgi:hypothetical protein
VDRIDQQERIASGAKDDGREIGRGRDTDHVVHDGGYGVRRDGLEGDAACPCADETAHHGADRWTGVGRAQRQEPQHADVPQGCRQRAQRDETAGVRPLEVVQHHEQRRLTRRFLERSLQVVDRPVAQVRTGLETSDRRDVRDRRVCPEHRSQQRRERHGLLGVVPLTGQHLHPETSGHRCCLGKYPGLADTRRSVDKYDAALPVQRLVEAPGDDGDLVVAPPNRRRVGVGAIWSWHGYRAHPCRLRSRRPGSRNTLAPNLLGRYAASGWT